ncbi:MAG: VanZ family protein, partial [Eubacterium sp.]|nr:VanZ family protein [Eubacterium sp.]
PILIKLYNKKTSYKNCIFIGLTLSLICEFIQYFIGRSCDIDDVILNTFSVIIGCLVFHTVKKFKSCNI